MKRLDLIFSERELDAMLKALEGAEVPGYTASGLVKPGKKVAHEMTTDDIKETIDAYASDAKI